MTSMPTQTMRMERLFDCTSAQMWAAWTDPAQYAKWISPFPGLDAVVHEMDVRVGGRVRFTMIGPDGTRFPEEVGTFDVVDPPRELVQSQTNESRNDIFAGHPMKLKARFEAVGDKTRVILEQTGLPMAIPLEMANEGFGACFDKLAAHLAHAHPHAQSSIAAAPKLRLERAFEATPNELWAAWTDPVQYAEWFNPAPGMGLVIHEFDVRPGGRVRFDMPQPDGNKNPQEGVFISLDPPRELVTGSPDKSFLVKVNFYPEGARTRMVVEVTGVPPQYHAMATVGWNAGFDKLVALLSKRRTGTRAEGKA
jgi:uncharacterized protein YndB with AHSA1/START domain